MLKGIKLFLVLLLMVFACNKKAKQDPYANFNWYAMEVTASAYNSLNSQTNSNPHITAFGDSLYPGLPYIAV